MKRLLLGCSFAALATLATVAACKQGEGDRCQVDDDCGPNLVCNKAKSTCVSGENSDEIDAGIIDAVPADAPPDAPPDAP